MQGQYFTPDIPLTQVSQAYRNDPNQFISEKVFPVVTVPKKNFNIYYYGKENLKQVVNDTRTRFGETNVAQFSVTSKAFGPLVGHELMDGIDFDQDNMTEAPLDLEIDIVNNLSEMMALTKERQSVSLLSNTSIITQHAAASALWDDYVSAPTTYTSNPFQDLKAATESIRLNGLRAANTMIMSYNTFAVLQNHPALIERVKYSQLASLTAETLGNLFGNLGITQILVSSAVEDTAAEGLAASATWVWGKNVYLAYVTPTPGLRTVNGGYTFILDNGRYVDTWFEQKQKTKWVRNNDYYVPEVVGAEAFYAITGATS